MSAMPAPHCYAALLRGINVGRAKRIAMADLRALFETLGFSDVRTLLNSGNVVFAAPKTKGAGAESLQEKIEAALAKQLAVSANAVVLRADEVEAIVADNPLPQGTVEPSRYLIAVLRRSADAVRLDELVAKDWAPDDLAVVGRTAYMWCPKGFLDSPLPEAVGRALRDQVTTRNWATMTKLRAMLAG